MCVDHRGTDIAVAQQLLHGTDVVAVLLQVSGERVAKRVASELRNWVISAAPISAGWRLPWNRMNRRTHATYAFSVRRLA